MRALCRVACGVCRVVSKGNIAGGGGAWHEPNTAAREVSVSSLRRRLVQLLLSVLQWLKHMPLLAPTV